jgi:hypothetical protein
MYKIISCLFYNQTQENTIVSLRDDSRLLHTEHEQKAEIRRHAFKIRLGSSESTHMCFDFQTLLVRHDKLVWMNIMFIKHEIDNIIANIPTDKSPGLDGFNTSFIKRC